MRGHILPTFHHGNGSLIISLCKMYPALLFQITDLLVNITKHELKPKHRVLTNVEKEELLKKYSVDEKQVKIQFILIDNRDEEICHLSSA